MHRERERERERVRVSVCVGGRERREKDSTYARIPACSAR